MMNNPHNQFRIPGEKAPENQLQPGANTYSQALEDVYRHVESSSDTPEVHAEPFRPFLDSAGRVYSYRDFALAEHKEKNKGILNFGWVRKDLTDTVIIDNIERHLVYEKDGQKTKKDGQKTNKRFWLGRKDEIVQETRGMAGEEVAHYYFEEVQYLPDFSTRRLVIHYEILPGSVTKWVASAPYPVYLDELSNLTKTIARYEDRVREKLSPVDTTLHDLQEEIDEEYEDGIHAAEAMFSKAAVDRMVAEYKAKKAAENKDDYDLAA